MAAYLKEMGCDQVIEHVGGHGVIGVIKGASEGGVVASPGRYGRFADPGDE